MSEANNVLAGANIAIMLLSPTLPNYFGRFIFEETLLSMVVSTRSSYTPFFFKRNLNIKNSFPIIGIGASAGGLEALEATLSCAPENAPVAIVVLQHLDPDRVDSLVDILQRSARLPVLQIADNMIAKPGHVFVLPRNHGLLINEGIFKLTKLVKSNGLHLPIDSFFECLAKYKGSDSVGIILSGMGSDGTRGFEAIKSMGGLTYVQTPDSAKFNSMPLSAIKSGSVDGVFPPEDLIKEILNKLGVHATSINPDKKKDIITLPLETLAAVTQILRTQTQHDFSNYKPSTLIRRVQRRMELHRMSDIYEYVSYLKKNNEETQLLFKELLIGVTSFFRDPKVWEGLISEVIPSLFSHPPKGGVFRAWIAGCSTGEEAYSLAIAFRECIDRLKPDKNYSLKIFATDIDQEAIDYCRKGMYPKNISKVVSEERRSKFFVKESSGYKVSQTIRDMIVFAQQNVIMEPSFAKVDIIFCRNLLIYLNTDLQKKLFSVFHFSLNPGGVLVLGMSESVGDSQDFFEPIMRKWQVYRKISPSQKSSNWVIPTINDTGNGENFFHSTEKHNANLEESMKSYILEHFSDPAVVTNKNGDLIYTHGKISDYLDPSLGKVNLNIFAMVKEKISSRLTIAFTKALKDNNTVIIKDVLISEHSHPMGINLTVQPLNKSTELSGLMLIVFGRSLQNEIPQEIVKTKLLTNSESSNQNILNLQQALACSENERQAMLKKMRQSQEELTTINEELQSTNEELQATNEELTTSKEEMQSMNEELQAVNQELLAKVDELSQTSDETNNLLNSIEIATIFLDDQLRVRRFTEEAKHIIFLRDGDAGRPISDLATILKYPAMLDDIRYVLDEGIIKQLEVKSRNGNWFHVCIKPYKTKKNSNDGVVITFINIKALKTIQSELKDNQIFLENDIFDYDLIVAKVGIDLQYQWVYAPHFEAKGASWINKSDIEIMGNNKDALALVSLKKQAINNNTYVNSNLALPLNNKKYIFDIMIKPILNSEGKVLYLMMLAIEIDH